MELRLPFFIAAGICLVLAVSIEAASGPLAGAFGSETPGLAITMLALLDGILLYNLIWMLLSVLVPRSVTGRAQGIVTLVLSFFALLATVLIILATFALLMLMLALLVAVPFGTLAYLAAWGDFSRGAAASTLAIVMLLKLAFLVLAVLAHQRFLQNKGLLLLTGLSLGLTWVTGFVHALLPLFLVSIGDAVVALVIAILAAIWLLLLLIGSIIALVKAILSLRSVA